jgi:acetyl-CoA acetyltransferase
MIGNIVAWRTVTLEKIGGKRALALATMCVGVGQGVSLAIERV